MKELAILELLKRAKAESDVSEHSKIQVQITRGLNPNGDTSGKHAVREYNAGRLFVKAMSGRTSIETAAYRIAALFTTFEKKACE